MFKNWAQTDIGKVRADNEDAYWCGGEQDWFLALVADGMGGHQAGEVASEMAVDIIRRIIQANLVGSDITIDEAKDMLCQSVHVANNQIFHQAQRHRSLSGMGTTVTAVLFFNGMAQIAHVGDSRAYLLREGVLRQLTKDHSLVQELLDSGSIAPEEARYHPKRHLLTRVLGTAPDLNIDDIGLEIKPLDLVLLCTDGLTGELSDSEIKDVLTFLPPDQVPAELVRRALDRGGRDNVTVALVQAGEEL